MIGYEEEPQILLHVDIVDDGKDWHDAKMNIMTEDDYVIRIEHVSGDMDHEKGTALRYIDITEKPCGKFFPNLI